MAIEFRCLLLVLNDSIYFSLFSAHNEVNSQVSLESRNEVKLASLSNCLNISPTNTSSTINRVGQSTNIRKQKKNRTTYSPSQVQVFERAFQENPYPDSAKIETLAIDLNIEEQNVKVRFIYHYFFLVHSLID